MTGGEPCQKCPTRLSGASCDETPTTKTMKKKVVQTLVTLARALPFGDGALELTDFVLQILT